MRLEFYLRETASGIRRNGMVAFAAMSTAFIALFLFGLSLLIARQIDLLVEAITGNVEVTVYLTDPVKEETRVRLMETLEQLPAVDVVVFESKEEAYKRFLRLFAGQPTVTDTADKDAIPASLRVTLADTTQYEQIPAALACKTNPETDQTECGAPGVREVHDYRDVIDKLNTLTNVLTWSVLGIAALMLASAVALVANTLRMGMFARRREIGIMRLVGATNWRIRAPFLIEGLVESLVGGGAAVLVLFLGKVFFIDRLREQLLWLPLIRNSDVLWVGPFILLAATGIAVLAGTIGMRRFLDV